jgi:hypothetical protein
MIKKRMAVALAVSALTVGMGLFLGLDSGAASASPSVANPVAAPKGAVPSSEDSAVYQKVIDQIYGTPAQRRRSVDLTNTLIDKHMSACMSPKFTYDSAAFKADEFWASPGDNDLVAALGRFHQASSVKLEAQMIETQKAQTNYLKPGYDDAIKECEKTLPGKEYSWAARPASRVALNANDAAARTLSAQLSEAPIEFQNKVETLKDTPTAKELLADYRGCMAERGYQIESWFDLYKQVRAKFTELHGITWSELNQMPEWQAAVNAEEAAAAADVACRSDMVKWAKVSLRPTANSMLGDARVKALASEWKAIEREAITAGVR